jgi:hypothetical protein
MNKARRATLRIPSRSKYRNVKVKADGYTFDSKAEYAYYLILKDKLARGEIKGLEIHPRFTIICEFRDWQGGHHRKTEYEADFMYDDRSGKTWVDDVKGALTEVYKLKKKLFLSFYRGFCFREIPAKTLRRT